MTCKDCIHYDLCVAIAFTINHVINHENEAEKMCRHFKDKSKFNELPCKVGDTIYYMHRDREIVASRVGAVRTEYTMDDGTGILGLWSTYDYLLGQTWFTSREDAENRLNGVRYR